MAKQEQSRILIVCDKDNFSATLRQLLNDSFSCDITCVSSGISAMDAARDNEFDLILINSPIEGVLGDQIARTISKLTYASIVVFTPEEIAASLEKKTEGLGVFVVAKPLTKAGFVGNVKTALVASERSKQFYFESLKLKQKMKDMKIIERAKVLLVEYLKLNEEQAHKYIEQQAMELRKTRVEIAQNIIKIYEI